MISPSEQSSGVLDASESLADVHSLATLDALRARIREQTGSYLDPEIEEAVVMMNAFGFYTYQSCAGHVEQEDVDVNEMSWSQVKFHEHKVIGGPWIEFGAYDLSPDEDPFEVEQQSFTNNDIAKEFARTELKLLNLLDAFYEKRQVAADVRLIYHGEGDFTLTNQGHVLLMRLAEIPREERVKKLALYQTEFDAFAAFMRTKFLQ